MAKIAIIGSGPTGIYTLKGLLRATPPLSITIFETEAEVGKGTPYHPDINDQMMLANIASIELPPIVETLNEWLLRQSDSALEALRISRSAIHDREFYPRVVLGEFLQAQFRLLIEQATRGGFNISICPNHRVTDIKLRERDIQLTARTPDVSEVHYAFDHVVMATGHDLPETTELSPGYFISPWPAPKLKTIGAGSVGILGTSLSALDALVTVATRHGAFYLDPNGVLQYRVASESDAFRATLMSRKGLLPEADFYCEYPYSPLVVCTPHAVDERVAGGTVNLLNDIFGLFKDELARCDPDYAAHVGLPMLTVETFAQAYFADREASDPFVWAATNLAEAAHNKQHRITVPWRYAILRMHEVVGRAVPHLDEEDLKRFHKYLKSVFVDDYATVPHQSIERLLALKRAERLTILKLGDDYNIYRGTRQSGVEVHVNGQNIDFDAFIDATGQEALSARDLPFPSLGAQGVIRPAATTEAAKLIPPLGEAPVTRTGGVDLDDAFRPRFEHNLCNRLYCAAISYLLHKFPFVQGITSARDIGEIVSNAILDDVDGHKPLIATPQSSTTTLSPTSMLPARTTSQ